MGSNRKRNDNRKHDNNRGRETPEVEEEESEGSPEDAIEVEGHVVEQLRNATFRVDLGNGHMALAHTSGKMRKFRIRIMPGDRVVVALSPYDLTRGRIVYRHK